VGGCGAYHRIRGRLATSAAQPCGKFVLTIAGAQLGEAVRSPTMKVEHQLSSQLSTLISQLH
jgi:hypothetical protein